MDLLKGSNMGRPPIGDEKRFDSHVDQNGPLVAGMPSACWAWTASVNSGGYAEFRTGGRLAPRRTTAHRWNYERFVGPIPDGFQVDHLCKTRHCVNPDHLEAVLPAVNNERSDSPSAKKARQVLCQEGLHELSGDNLHPTYLRWGQRRCRACHAQRQREYRQRLRAQSAA